MPVGFNSPARNLFLLGSSGAQVVTNFFKTIDQSAGTDGVYLPDEIKYNEVDQKFVLAGSADDSNSKGFGWLEKRDDGGTADWNVRVEATTSVNTKLRALHLDSNNNLIVVGGVGDIPWIAKYSNGGAIDWQSTTNSGDVEYTGVTSDSNGNYYACGSTPTTGDAQAFVEKFDTNGNPGWGKSAFMLGRDVVLEKIAANSRGEVVAVGLLQDDEAYKGYIVKIDTNTGEVLWDRTLRSYEPDVTFGYTPVFCEGVFIDSKDQIYIVGRYFGLSESRAFIVKYTAEGNMVWQKETPVGENIEYYEVKSDGETEQTVVFGRYFDSVNNDWGGILSKYSKDGTLVWRRTLFSSYQTSNYFGQAGGNGICLDADPSFYYLLYFDDAVNQLNGTPEAYTFGKVSSSGNGLGDFEYEEGTGETIFYEILNVQDKIGRLSDGSVRNDTSDNLVYPFNGTKILFDDLATQVANKKRQMDTADSFEYSGSPAIRPADFQELNLLGDVYSGSGNWLDQSGKGNNGIIPFSGPFTGSGSLNFPGGSADRLEIANSADFNFGTGAYTIEMFIKTTASAGWLYHENDPNNSGMRLCVGTNGSTGSNDGRIEFNEQVSNGDNAIQGTTQINDGEWHHIAVVRGASGDTTKLYVDGVLDATGSANRNFDSNDTLYIGARGTYGGNEYAGEISNLRVVKGVQVYTGNFTPPSEPLTDITGTSLLIGGSSITDISSNARTITTVGSITPKNPSPTHNAAGYWEFDGVDDGIKIPRTHLYQTGDEISVEAWINIDNISDEDYQAFFSIGGVTATNRDRMFQMRVADYTTSGGGEGHIDALYRDSTNTTWHILRTSGTPIANNTWYHVVSTFTYGTGSSWKIYLNGVEQSTTFHSGNGNADPIQPADPSIYIGLGEDGRPAFNTGSGEEWLGKIGEVRLYHRALTPAQVFQNYNATREKYTGVPASTNPGLTSTRTPA